MSLRDLIQSLKSSSRSTLMPLVDRWLLEQNAMATSVEGYLHPSSIPSLQSLCPRAVFFDLFTPFNLYPEELLAEDHSPQTRRIFDNGHHMHRRWQAYLIEMGICDPRVRFGWEIPIQDDSIAVRGHADAIVYPEAKNTVRIKRAGLANGEFPISDAAGGFEYTCEKPWKPAGKPRMVELKSINDYKFQMLIGPMAKHQMQATCYMALLKECGWPTLDETLFIYENKNTQEVKEFPFPLDLDLWSAIKDMQLKNVAHKQRGTLPDRICASAADSRAQECVWPHPCFRFNTYTELIKISHAKATKKKAAVPISTARKTTASSRRNP